MKIIFMACYSVMEEQVFKRNLIKSRLNYNGGELLTTNRQNLDLLD